MTLIAIDGPAGAGKTTLATKFFAELSVDKSVVVIHMDDLYDGWDNALSDALTSTLDEILRAYKTASVFTLSIFNWKTMSFDSTRSFQPSDIVIIEGVGAGQKIVRDAGATLYWLDIEPDKGLARVLQRDGVEIESQMRRWQITQDAHFAGDATRMHADHIITSQA
jgi:uridine kinase